MYEVKISFMVGDSNFEMGDRLDEKDIPKKSKKWLLEQGIVEKYVEENKVRARNSKGHYIADDPKTSKNEAWEEE